MVSGDRSGALAAFSDFASDYERVLNLTLMELSEGMARIPYIRMQEDTDLVLESLARLGDGPALNIALAILASRNGRLQEMQGDRARIYRASAVFRQRTEYHDLVERASLPDNLSPTPGTDSVQAAIIQLSDAEDKLTGNAVRDRQLRTFTTTPISIDEILTRVTSNTTILSYSLIPHTDGWSAIRTGNDYVLWTLHPHASPTIHVLGDSDMIDNQIRGYLAALGAPHRNSNSFSRSNTTELVSRSHALLSALIPDSNKVPTGTSLIIVPDGLIQTVPFAALADVSGDPLISHVDVAYGTSLRNIVRNLEAPISQKPAVLIGNPSMGESLAINDIFYMTPSFFSIREAAAEVGSIYELLGAKAKLYIGQSATEGLIKSLVSPSILHIAAHGQFIQARVDEFLDAEIDFEQPNGLSAEGIHIANPFLRSYIALAEYSQVQPLNHDDGILTALEIVGLDLEGTELAIASGCSTSIGPIQRGEVMYGMRAAFTVAGAKTQVLSLWETGDTSTRTFMTHFYGLMLGSNTVGRKSAANTVVGLPTLTALSTTQRDFLHDPQFSDPFYWAAFTASGINRVLGIAQH